MPKFLGSVRGKICYNALYRCDKCFTVYHGLVPAENCEKRHREEQEKRERMLKLTKEKKGGDD